EDGIRDRTVTGVQTCALPIYRRHRLLGIVGPVRERKIGRGDDLHGAQGAIDRAWPPSCPVNDNGQKDGKDPRGQKAQGWRDDEEIGRASCRERGEIWGGGGGW